MSGSGQDDLLKKMLQSVPRGATSTETGEGVGLNPLDLLGLPPAQRDLINWLSRRKQARFEEIQEALSVEGTQLTNTLAALKTARHVQEALIDGEIYYRVVFGGKVSRAARGLPEGIWERVDLDSTIFLRQVALFRGLSDDHRREIAASLDPRRYHRNEVIFWQGGLGEGIYLIKSGIVGITRLTPNKRETQILSYLKQGDLLGEYGLLFDQNIVSGTTATALSEVDVLVMKRQQMLDLLKKYPSVAVELVQMLAERLLALTAQPQQIIRVEQHTTVCLVLAPHPGVGSTTLGCALATNLARATQNATVYTEHPTANHLPSQLGFGPEMEVSAHPGGFDVFVPHGLSGIPAAVRTTLVMDRLSNHYANIVIGVAGPVNESVIYLLEQADQAVLVTTPDQESFQQSEALRARLQAIIRPEKTNVCVVCIRTDAQADLLPLPGGIDFDVRWSAALPPLPQFTHDNLPESLRQVATTLADQLGRSNRIGIFIPALVETNPTLKIQPFVDRALTFLRQLFGGAPDYPSHTMPESGQAGVAAERIHIIQTYVTKSDLDRHLVEVLAFVEAMKTELGQEAMALEVNHNIMLV